MTVLVPVQAIPPPTVQAMAGQLVLPRMPTATLSSLANKVQIYFLHIKLNFISQQPWCARGTSPPSTFRPNNFFEHVFNFNVDSIIER